MSTQRTRRPAVSTGDRIGLWFFIVVGAALAIWAVVAAALRIAHVLPNRDVEVYGVFSGTVADAPIGVGGAAVPVELEAAWLTVPQLPAAGVGAAVIEPIVAAVAVVVFVACAILLAHGVLRGRVFSRRSTALVTTAGLAGIIGYAGTAFFGNMVANAAFAQLSDGTFDNVVLSVDLLPLLLGAFIAALVATVFAIGDRLQRETDLLV